MTGDPKEEPAKSPSGPRSTSADATVGWYPYLAVCAIGLVIALTWIGPNAADGLGTLNAMAFWAVHVVPAIALLAITQMALGRIGIISDLPGIAQVIASALVASVLFTPLALGIDAVFEAEGSLDDQALPLAIRAVSEFAQFVVPLVLIWCLINAPSLLQLERVGGGGQEGADDPSENDLRPPELTEFWSRIPGRLGRDLVALSAELHYLRVFTTQGEALILFPFGRAVDLLQQENGMQVHRSHWVSLDHVDEVVTRDGRLFCEMVGGPSVPVSRSYRSALKAARIASG